MRIKLLLIMFLCCAILLPLSALELGVFFDMGNMSFKEEPLSSTTFSSNKFPWGIAVQGNQLVGDGLNVDFGYKNDRTMNHLAFGTFTYTGDFFSMGAGPAFGLFNSPERLLQPGIATNFRIEWPGLTFLRFDLLSSIGAKMSSLGDYNQNQSSISLGFYIPNAICSLNMVQKSYEEMVSIDDELQDSLNSMTEYSFKSEIYKKNIPFKLLIGLLYRITTNNYVKQEISGTAIDALSLTDVTLSQTMNSILLQTRMDMSFTPWLTMIFDASSSIFAFGTIENGAADTKETLQFTENDFPNSYLFEVSVGFRVNLDSLRQTNQ